MSANRNGSLKSLTIQEARKVWRARQLMWIAGLSIPEEISKSFNIKLPDGRVIDEIESGEGTRFTQIAKATGS